MACEPHAGAQSRRLRWREIFLNCCNEEMRARKNRVGEETINLGSLKQAQGETLENARSIRSLVKEATMGGATKQALRFQENLTLPKVQVVVLRANMGCSHCQSRVSQVVSKMNAGLLDYEVDLGKKEVVVRGMVDVKRMKPSLRQRFSRRGRTKSSASFNPFRLLVCSGAT